LRRLEKKREERESSATPFNFYISNYKNIAKVFLVFFSVVVD